MFRQLAAQLTPSDVFLSHPIELLDYLERVWAVRSNRPGRPSPETPQPLMAGLPIRLPLPQTDWHHLIYAYMIESTGVIEIFERVLHECLNGERLGLTAESQMWLRNTEDLFYKTLPSFSICNVKSEIRPDTGDVRRNAYYRMFGAIDLSPLLSDGNDFVKPERSNLGFVQTFEEFLRETWIGIENVMNISGPNQTDNGTIATLARRLSDMLRDRRQNGTLSREEFFAVAIASWFHLTVELNSPIVRDLRAEGTSPEQRLGKLGEKVGFPASKNAESFFRLAVPTQAILIRIESQDFNQSGDVESLFQPASSLRTSIETILTHWSLVTGRMLKARKVAVSP